MRIIALIAITLLIGCHIQPKPVIDSPPIWTKRKIGRVVVGGSGNIIVHQVSSTYYPEGRAEAECIDNARLSIARWKGWIKTSTKEVTSGDNFGDMITIERIIAGPVFGRPIDIIAFWFEIQPEKPLVHCLGISPNKK